MGNKKNPGQPIPMTQEVRDMLDMLDATLEDDGVYDHIRRLARWNAAAAVIDVINVLAHAVACDDPECGRAPSMTDDEVYAGLALAGKMLTSVGLDKPAKGAKHAEAWAELNDLINEGGRA